MNVYDYDLDGMPYMDTFEIAKALCDCAMDKDYLVVDDIQQAIYDLKLTAQNEFNAEGWRTLYKILMAIAYERQGDIDW